MAAKFFLLIQVCAALAIFCVIVFRPVPWNTGRWIGAAIAVPAMLLLLVARIQLGNSFSVTPQARVLVTHGLYSKIRNPMYVFSALLILGFVLTLKPYATLFILAIFVPVQIIRAHQEGKVLETKFGDEYREYKKQTWL